MHHVRGYAVPCNLCIVLFNDSAVLFVVSALDFARTALAIVAFKSKACCDP